VINFFSYSTIVGDLTISEENRIIIGIRFGKTPFSNKYDICTKYEKLETEYIKQAYLEIAEYLNGKRQLFDFKFKFEGTSFQKTVWKALLQIPFGETRSYKDVANFIEKPLACRAVGLANNKNPMCIVVPCHRVIGNNGKILGYAGGIEVKQKLLKIESN
jgi:methylated-DNA-[protein]-cysteine S-methyltransferase